jgi:PHD/YefM family antitoxin component YafN of YafNO toxin-antitoxin module
MAEPIRVPQAQVRRRWRWVERISSQTPVLITRCGQPWAVVMGVEPYMAAKTAARLASLREPGGGERLRSVLTEPAHLDGQVLAGVAAPPRAEGTLHP